MTEPEPIYSLTLRQGRKKETTSSPPDPTSLTPSPLPKDDIPSLSLPIVSKRRK